MNRNHQITGKRVERLDAMLSLTLIHIQQRLQILQLLSLNYKVAVRNTDVTILKEL